MFVFELKENPVCLKMALLLLCYSVSLHSCYPHAEEDEDPAEADQNLDNEEDQEGVHDEGEESSEEVEDTDVENAEGLPNFNAARACVLPQGNCGPTENPDRLPCCRHVGNGDFYFCEKYFPPYEVCSRIRNEPLQNALKAWSAFNGIQVPATV